MSSRESGMRVRPGAFDLLPERQIHPQIGEASCRRRTGLSGLIAMLHQGEEAPGFVLLDFRNDFRFTGSASCAGHLPHLPQIFILQKKLPPQIRSMKAGGCR